MVAEIIEAIFHSPPSANILAKRKLAIQQLADAEFVRLTESIALELAQVPETGYDWRRLESWFPSFYSRSAVAAAEQERLLAAIRQMYLNAPAHVNLRNLCLAWLARLGDEASLDLWADLLVSAPPEFRLGIHLAFAPLLRQPSLRQSFFDRLLETGLGHAQLAAPILDLMNFQTREGILSRHPASHRAAELTRLLGGLVDRLERIEEGLGTPDQEIAKIQQTISDSVSMIVALCDALALMGYHEAEGKLLRAADLRHRRVQTEAAAALARLGFAAGKSKLIELAGEPTARLRVLAYADELNLLQEIPETHQSEIALAESKLANWLAEPQQMGLAPSSLSLMDCREMYWPGFEHPVLCYLFRFHYGSAGAGYTNVGIVGPLVHSFEFDVSWMSHDDLYAAFAGWHAVHDDIYEIPLDECERLYPGWIERVTQRLTDQGYTGVQPEFVGIFMESKFLVAAGEQHETSGFAIANEQTVNWFANSEHAAQVTAEWAYMVYRGRLILKTFNRLEVDPFEDDSDSSQSD